MTKFPLFFHVRVVMNRIEKGASFPKYHDTFFWLSDSMIANECFNCSDPNVGLSLNEDRTYVKCYMGDTGLLISHTFDENEISDGELYREILLGKLYDHKKALLCRGRKLVSVN